MPLTSPQQVSKKVFLTDLPMMYTYKYWCVCITTLPAVRCLVLYFDQVCCDLVPREPGFRKPNDLDIHDAQMS